MLAASGFGLAYRICLAAALIATLAGVAPAYAARSIPVGVYNVNNSALSQGAERMYAIRFVLDRSSRIHRFYSGMNWEGVYADAAGPAPVEIRSSALNKGYPSPRPPQNLPAGWSPGKGRPGYAHGTGGIIRARLVAMSADGTPDLSRVLAEETYPALQRYREIKAEFGFDGRSGLVYSKFGGVQVPAGVPHFVIYQNVDSDPRTNFVSLNSPVTSEQAAGPNGDNNLDAGAPGAVAGLDPRESVGWSLDSGRSWGWGQDVGRGPVPGDYTMSGDDAVKLPWYAWQGSQGAPMQANQPYYAYTEKGRYTLRLRSAPRTTTLTEAGGYGPNGESVGAVTVRNLRTGAVGRTGALGSGLVKGKLDTPVLVKAGDSYEITHTGIVAKAEGDKFLQDMGLIGPGKTPFETVGHEYDRAELFATPHPWFSRVKARSPRKGPQGQRRKKSSWPRGPRVILKSAKVLRRADASDLGPRPHDLRLAGMVLRGRGLGLAGRRIVVQVLRRGRWQSVSRTRLQSNGRFEAGGRVLLPAHARQLGVRVRAAGIGKSRAWRVALR